jgi:BirA family transcriptional regulator, biotin operon repressor / biotin---[acetyl-CoA-carboxylase] ligase
VHVTEADLRPRLEPSARQWVREVYAFESIPSTNDFLKEAARKGAPEGTVVIARQQTAGRGRQGRAWESPAGNLFLSFLLRPTARGTLSLIPLAVGLAVADALEGQGAACRLKWPNDVLAHDRKLAGILAEASADAAGVDAVVVGIGVNVSLDPDALPEDVRDSATSLSVETRRAHELVDVAAAVLGRWVLWYDALQSDRARVRTAWRERSVDWWGRTVEVTSSGQRVTGLARDIDDSGALLLEAEDGRTVTILSGDAHCLRPAR